MPSAFFSMLEETWQKRPPAAPSPARSVPGRYAAGGHGSFCGSGVQFCGQLGVHGALLCLIGSHCLISQGGALAVSGQHSAHLADDVLHFLIVRCLHRIQSAASRQCNGDFARLRLLRLRQRLVFCLCPGNAAVQLRLSARLDTVQLLQQRLDLRLVGSFLFTGRGRRFFCGRSSAGAGCAGSVLLLAGRGRIAALRLGAASCSPPLDAAASPVSSSSVISPLSSLSRSSSVRVNCVLSAGASGRVSGRLAAMLRR